MEYGKDGSQHLEVIGLLPPGLPLVMWCRAGVASDCCGESGAEPGGKAFVSPVDLCPTLTYIVIYIG